jgi:hypothetical protein
MVETSRRDGGDVNGGVGTRAERRRRLGRQAVAKNQRDDDNESGIN